MSIFIIVFIFSILSFILGVILSYSASVFICKNNPIIEKINDCFPQSQCGQCGYPGCYPYAQAIGNNKENINKCLPGGEEVILRISEVLNIEVPIFNQFQQKKETLHKIVFIDEKNCIGCSKCASFCPVDAIVGAPDYMHTVLQDFCTGCNICISHCPTNCIIIKQVTQ